MQKMSKRRCQSEKECSNCQVDITIGQYYYCNPNKSMCEVCKKKEDDLAVVREKIAKENIKKVGSENVDYTEKCKYCDKQQQGEINHIPVCLMHIDTAIEQSV